MKSKILSITEKAEKFSGKTTRVGKIVICSFITCGVAVVVYELVQIFKNYKASKAAAAAQEEQPVKQNTDYKYVVLNDEADEKQG